MELKLESDTMLLAFFAIHLDPYVGSPFIADLTVMFFGGKKPIHHSDEEEFRARFLSTLKKVAKKHPKSWGEVVAIQHRRSTEDGGFYWLDQPRHLGSDLDILVQAWKEEIKT